MMLVPARAARRRPKKIWMEAQKRKNYRRNKFLRNLK